MLVPQDGAVQLGEERQMAERQTQGRQRADSGLCRGRSAASCAGAEVPVALGQPVYSPAESG